MSGPEAATETSAGGEPAAEGQNSGEAPSLGDGAAGSTPASPPAGQATPAIPPADAEAVGPEHASADVPAPKPRRTTKPGTALRKEAAKLWEALTPPQVEARLAIVTLFATRGQISDIGAVDQDDDAYRISNALGEILEGKVSIDVDLEAGAGTLTVAGKALRFLANADGEWEHIPAPHLVAEEDEGS